MLVQDIMTRAVKTVEPETPVADIAKLLLENRISGVPVVNRSYNVMGIVSEGDLMRRPEIETDQPRSWWLRMMTDSREQAADYIKTHGRRAEQVMTREVVTTTEDTSVSDVALALERHRIKRVPVVRENKLVGIVCRANLLQSLAAGAGNVQPRSDKSLDDRALREKVFATLNEQPWATNRPLNVIVADGAVELWGWLESEEEQKAAQLAAESVPGVRSVETHLGKVAPYLYHV